MMGATRPVVALLALVAVVATARADEPIDSLMDRSPELPAPRVVKTFPKGLAEALIEALDRPDADTKVAAAQSIALASRRGLTGLDAATAPLVRELDRPGQHATTRLAAAHALVALDARQTADGLFRALDSDDAELRELVEPALARWDYRPTRAAWLERLGQGPPYRRRHVLAIQGLAAVREERAGPVLRGLALSPEVPAPVRLEAARALGVLRPSGLEKDAAALAADSKLVAASLLRHHQGDEAVGLLQALGRDPDPTAAAVALARLVEIDTKLVLPLLEPVLASPDANVRSFGVEALFRQPTDDRIRLLGDRLADPDPGVRGRARQAMGELAARPEFRGPVVREGMRVLGGADWRGQERAAVLLARLDHKPAAGRLVELLRTDRPEAFVAAAWGLRVLAVPDTLPVVLDFVRAEHKRMLKSGSAAGRRGVPADAIDRQLTQLVQLLGQARYRPAAAALREILPRLVPGQPGTPPQTPVGVETRAAVAWALGMLHEGKPEPALVQALEARITDLPSPAGAEADRVRRMAAVSLGRMKAQSAVPTLRRFYGGKPTLDPVNNACGWALERITGEPVPPPGTVEQTDRPWFLGRLE